MEVLATILFILLSRTVKLYPRYRRQTLQRDDRIQIKSHLLNRFPFESMVKLNNGCTGTLIWYKHVLTSAHCLSNGRNLISSINKIKVGFLQKDANFKWIKVRKVFLPKAWLKNQYKKYLDKDYAVIELMTSHNRKWLPLDVATPNTKHMQFAGFPSDKPANELWFSHCKISKQYKHILLNHCTAAKGVSGSGIYTYDPTVPNRRTLIAVFSSQIKYANKNCNDGNHEYVNVATRLTKRKIEKICGWMKAGKQCSLIKSTIVSN